MSGTMGDQIEYKISETDETKTIASDGSAISPKAPTTIKYKQTKNRKIVQGETIFKGHRSYDIMVAIQTGLRYMIGRLKPSESMRELVLSADIRVKIPEKFPREGSSKTPPHPSSSDFKFKDYAPVVFLHLRDRFGLDPSEYMMSLCGDGALSELSTPGKSGALFYFSHDNKFLIKTISKKESKFLLGILAHYYNYVMQNPNTLLTRFFGLHSVTPFKGRRVRFVVMSNLFKTSKVIHDRFDLKGATVGRSITEGDRLNPDVTKKDLDFLAENRKIYLGPTRKKTFRSN